MAWQIEKRDPQGKATKIPYAPGGAKGKANDPTTWGTRREAEGRARRLPLPFGKGGVGLQLGVVGEVAVGGIDLDTCRDDAGNLAPWAEEIIRRFETYAEVSPSASGVKLFFTFEADAFPAIRKVLGAETGRKWAREGGDHPPGIEIYFAGRYFAVTDKRLDGSPEVLRLASPDDISWLVQEAGPAMAGGGTPSPSRATKGGKPGRDAPTGGDKSRSARAFRLACDLARKGERFDAFLTALDAEPDLKEWRREKGDAAGGRELRRTWEKAEAVAAGSVLLTEHGVAKAFADLHRDDLRYCHDTGAWFQWTGTHWARDRKQAAFSFARDLTADANRGEDFKVQAATGRAAFARGVETFAQRDPFLAVTAEDWDKDPFLLATPGGVVDLRTGELRPARPEEMMTRLAAVAPVRGEVPELWLRFLRDTTGDDEELITFLQRWCGYCLTGDTSEQALLFGYGPGGNGKSVFINTLSRILGDYAAVAAMDTFTASPGDRHPTDIAMLRGARLVTATETEEGKAWAESRIKQMTGGDAVSARFMRGDFFTFRPQFKLTIVGNHKPVLRNVDDAARRRFNIVPFVRKPETPDPDLEVKLRAEWPAILGWMIEGCLNWAKGRLGRPKAVSAATDDYFEAQDYFGQWLADCCILDANRSTKPADLLASFKRWCAMNGEPETDNRRLRGMIEKHGKLRYVKSGGNQFVRGIGLRPSEDQKWEPRM